MTAVVVPTPGGPEALTCRRLVLRPDPAEVLIKIAAAGLNGADLTQRMGRHDMPPGATDILGLEASGTIVALGDGVTEWKIGDAVCALLIGGGYAEYVTAPAVQCLPSPRGVGCQRPGCPEVVITVWLNVFRSPLRSLRDGKPHGGASGIGTMAIQPARALGARPYATAGSPENARAAPSSAPCGRSTTARGLRRRSRRRQAAPGST
jgi:NADPH:quinone reductase-like Zn-dependent oxidoreductase